MTAMDRELQDVAAALGARYRVERELGRGGMGAVYLARDLQLDRNVAVKVLPRDFANDALLRERFVRETRMAASFSHPNIVPVHAVEEREGMLAFVMGFVEGDTLAQRVARGGPLSPRECVRMMQDIAYALAYAHGRGVVHRDIKPDNIMLERATGRALLMDFGVSRAANSPASSETTNPAITRVGESVGTPEFMSPEQAAGEQLDGRSDLYSLGLTAYFALLGKPAYSGDSVQRLLVRQLTEAVPPLASLRGDLPAPLASAVDRCLAKDREARFADAPGLVEALDVANAAAPEVPVAVRLFAQEAESLGLVIAFVLLFTMFWVFTVVGRTDSDDPLILLVVIIGVLSMRVAQTLSEARRLFGQGFTMADVMRGFQSTLDERDARRQQLRSHAPTRTARRRTVIIATTMLLVAPMLIAFARQFRVEIRPGFYSNPLGGSLMFVSGALMLAFALPLLLRSPFRAPVGERLFRLTWMGAPGRLLLNRAARRAGATVTTVNASAPALVAKPLKDADRLASLEARVAKLESGRARN
ncbi:MAG TPA: serine/threonine-protein kinase [Gemmatimonas sp.]|nr:serine/threonine-protein kinase [Gemmatimonas sp.]